MQRVSLRVENFINSDLIEILKRTDDGNVVIPERPLRSLNKVALPGIDTTLFIGMANQGWPDRRALRPRTKYQNTMCLVTHQEDGVQLTISGAPAASVDQFCHARQGTEMVQCGRVAK